MTVTPFPRGGAHLHRVSSWLTDLFRFTTNNPPPAELAARITAYASFLAENFHDDGAFCRASLDHVAGQCRFFPSYAEVNRSLGVWWKEHRPQLAALPPPAPPPRQEPTEEAHAYVADVVRKLRAELGFPEDAMPDQPIPAAGQSKPGHLSDGHLIATYEKLAADGSLAALTRLEMLKKKIARSPEG